MVVVVVVVVVVVLVAVLVVVLVVHTGCLQAAPAPADTQVPSVVKQVRQAKPVAVCSCAWQAPSQVEEAVASHGHASMQLM